MATNNIAIAIKQIADEKNLSMEAIIGAIEAALAAAFRKEFGNKNQNIKAVFNADNGQTAIFDVKTVVEDVDLEKEEKLVEEQKEKKEAGEEIPEEDLIKRFNPRSEIMLSEANEDKGDYKIGDIIENKLEVPDEYGRMAAQTAKQVIVQRLREAERENIFTEYKDKEGELVLGTIQRNEGRRFIVDLGKANAILPIEEQIRTERYTVGARLNFFITEVRIGNKGPEIILSRTHPEIVKELFATEVPEIAAGTVEIKAISREAGSRSKIAVITTEENIDPVGSCVGQRGSRVQTVINELGGEKIDIIEWDEDVKIFISNSLSPAEIESIDLNEEEKTASIKVADDQLSLAIGRGGQNVRLAAKLTGWKIDIISSETGDKISADNKKEKESKDGEVEEENTEDSKEKSTTKKKTSKSKKDEADDKSKEDDLDQDKEVEEEKSKKKTSKSDKKDKVSKK